MSTNIFESFQKASLEIYELDPVRFLAASGLALQAPLKKTNVKPVILTDIGMLQMIDKCIRSGICHAIHRYAKANKKYMKDYDKNKESSYLKHWDVNNLYKWTFPVNDFKWLENKISEMMRRFDVQKTKNLHNLHNDLPFLPERTKIKKGRSQKTCSQLAQ